MIFRLLRYSSYIVLFCFVELSTLHAHDVPKKGAGFSIRLCLRALAKISNRAGILWNGHGRVISAHYLRARRTFEAAQVVFQKTQSATAFDSLFRYIRGHRPDPAISGTSAANDATRLELLIARATTLVGDEEGAHQSYVRAFALKPPDLGLNAELHWRFGQHLNRLQEYQAAITHLEKANELVGGEGHPETYFFLANSYMKLGLYDEDTDQLMSAIRYYRQAKGVPTNDSLMERIYREQAGAAKALAALPTDPVRLFLQKEATRSVVTRYREANGFEHDDILRVTDRLASGFSDLIGFDLLQSPVLRHSSKSAELLQDVMDILLARFGSLEYYGMNEEALILLEELAEMSKAWIRITRCEYPDDNRVVNYLRIANFHVLSRASMLLGDANARDEILALEKLPKAVEAAPLERQPLVLTGIAIEVSQERRYIDAMKLLEQAVSKAEILPEEIRSAAIRSIGRISAVFMPSARKEKIEQN